MQTGSSFYWSRPSSADQSSLNNYQSEQVSISKSRNSLWDSKVSPRIHKLSDPQRSNLPAQAYLRLDIRLPSSKSIRPFPLEHTHNAGRASTAVTSALTTAVNTPVARQAINFNHKSHTILPQYVATTSSKAKYHSRHESIKSSNELSNQKEEHKALEERGLLKEPNRSNRNSIGKEALPLGQTPERILKIELSPRVSPYNNVRSAKTHLLENTEISSRKLSSQRSANELKEEERSAQQLTFRTNAGIRIDTEGQSKQDEGEDMGCESYGGFTTFRGYLDKENIQEFIKDNKVNLSKMIQGSQGAVKKRLNFEANGEESRRITQRIKSTTGRENKFEELMRDETKREINREEKKNRNSHREEIRGWSQTGARVVSNASIYERDRSEEKVNYSKRRQKSLHDMCKDKENESEDLLQILYGEMKNPTATEQNEAKKHSRQATNKKNDAEIMKLKKMMMELQKKTLEKDMEILNLKKESKINETEAKEINFKVSQVVMATKRSEDNLEQLTQQVACQEREITFLSKCKERLESILPSPDDYGMDIHTYFEKVREYEKMLVEKEREAQEICAKVRELESDGKVKIETERAKGRDEVRRLELEVKVRDQEKKQLREAIEEMNQKLSKYVSVEEKMIVLENTQNQLIEENDKLKSQLPVEARKRFEKFIQEKTLASRLSTILYELNASDECSKKLIKLLEAILKGNDLPLGIIKTASSLNKENRKSISKEMLKNINLRELSQKNVEISEKVHKRLIMCMDDICEEYARACGRNCNIQ